MHSDRLKTTVSSQDSSCVDFARLSSALAVQGASDIPNNSPVTGQTNGFPQLAPTPTGFALLWSPATSLADTTNSYEELKTDGSASRGPVSLANQYMAGTSLVAHPGGTVVFAPHLSTGTPPTASVILQRMSGCSIVGNPVTVATLPSTFLPLTSAVFTAGTGFAVLWTQQNTTTNHQEIWSRTFGPLFCN
jgi:hypothetical protein